MEELLNLISLVLEDSTIENIGYKLEFMKAFIRFADSIGVSEKEMRDLLAHGEFMFITAAFYFYMQNSRDIVVVDPATKRLIDNQFSKILIHRPPSKVSESNQIVFVFIIPNKS